MVILSKNKKVNKFLVCLSLVVFFLFAGSVKAFYIDWERIRDNSFSASSLEVHLHFLDELSDDSLEQEEIETGSLEVENVGQINFQYHLGFKKISKDASLCEALKLTAKKQGVKVYEGLLQEFDYYVEGMVSFEKDSWEFELGLPKNPAADLMSRECNFEFELTAWQENFSSPAQGWMVKKDFGPNEVQTGIWTKEGNVVINEVYYDGVGSEGDEFVELYNTGAVALDLSEYKIGDEETKQGTEGMYKFPSDASIDGQGYVVIARKALDFKNTFGFLPDYEMFETDPSVPNLTLYNTWASGTFQLSNSGDEVILLNAQDEIIDAVSFENGSVLGVVSHPGVAEGHSLERNPIGYDTDNCAQDFVDIMPPQPFQN